MGEITILNSSANDYSLFISSITHYNILDISGRAAAH